jgi:hypothetical protein
MCDHTAATAFRHSLAASARKILDVSAAERETQVDPHGMLDDNRRKAVTTVGELHHPVSLLAPLTPAMRLF